MTFDPPQLTYRDIKEGIYNISDVLDMIEIVEMKEELRSISIETQQNKLNQEKAKEKTSKRKGR